MTRRRREVDERARDAAKLYETFHRFEPRAIGSFPASFVIPEVMYLAGKAIDVMYRSGKVDPESLRKPSKPVNYIHEHEGGVKCYLPRRDTDGPETSVPARFRDVAALTRLGYCLGFKFEEPDGHAVEGDARPPLPDLYATPDGKCLLVIQSKRRVLAMMWGGDLGVYARGIDG